MKKNLLLVTLHRVKNLKRLVYGGRLNIERKCSKTYCIISQRFKNNKPGNKVVSL